MPLYVPSPLNEMPVSSVERSATKLCSRQASSQRRRPSFDGEELDKEARRLLLLVGLLFQDPVLAAVGVLLERKLGALQVDFRQHHPAGEQRQHADRGFDHLGVQQIVGLAPVGVGEADALGAQARMDPGPDRAKVAFDHQLAAGGIRDRAGDRTLEQIQAECKKEGDYNEENRNGSRQSTSTRACAPSSKVHACRAYTYSDTRATRLAFP
jgi:hypothetical protein